MLNNPEFSTSSNIRTNMISHPIPIRSNDLPYFQASLLSNKEREVPSAQR